MEDPEHVSDSSGGEDPSGREEASETGPTGVLNPTTCLQLGDVLLFTVSGRLFPQYDLYVPSSAPPSPQSSTSCVTSHRDNLFNTNADFDWGAFRKLEDELTLSPTPPGFFSLILDQPGVYVLTLSGRQHRHLVKENQPERC